VSATALKEWSAAVHAMLDGRQTVLLRKGGIGEKRFDLAAPEFVFFPTVAHGHAERVRPEHRDLLDAAASDSTETELVVRAGAKVVAAVAVNRPDGLDEIVQTHIRKQYKALLNICLGASGMVRELAPVMMQEAAAYLDLRFPPPSVVDLLRARDKPDAPSNLEDVMRAMCERAMPEMKRPVFCL